jgi:hypothetical protein
MDQATLPRGVTGRVTKSLDNCPRLPSTVADARPQQDDRDTRARKFGHAEIDRVARGLWQWRGDRITFIDSPSQNGSIKELRDALAPEIV